MAPSMLIVRNLEETITKLQQILQVPLSSIDVGGALIELMQLSVDIR